ncbi:conserved hypothetical protein [Histoplasma capsulatum var. duboisii H88]|uniref:Fungal-type protein kinase domain-containing protein n=1 Tax=Ajellomyces capsulatus (strain H88) TaxID=544711 RepID=F0UFD0_AJEC8|nr:conserved hypothetical protein [Histoplasma capsulatum var. duboisii H88]
MKKQLIIDKIVEQAHCVIRQATICWKYLEHTEEEELLQKVMMKGVKHVTRYYHHKTVCIDNKNDDVLTIRKSLSIPISKDEKNDFKMRVKSIYKSSLKTTLLTELTCCIEEYMSLHDEAGLIQCNVSLQNLMMNKNKDNSL